MNYQKMRYPEFDINNPRCIHCYISDRAYSSVITEVMTNGQNETGGAFLGYIVRRAWYIVESIDPGVDTVNERAFFRWDSEYVNHQAARLSKIYRKPLTVLGFWHRHPGSMDYFSQQDEITIQKNLQELHQGLLSMLVNIDPKLRMTYYYCYGADIMRIRYDVGDKYFPVELLKYANAEELTSRAAKQGRPMDIFYEQVIDLDALAARAIKAAPQQPQSPAAKQPQPLPASAPAGGDYLSDSTIKRVAELVAGLEGDTKQQIYAIHTKLDSFEETLQTLLQGTAQIRKTLEEKEAPIEFDQPRQPDTSAAEKAEPVAAAELSATPSRYAEVEKDSCKKENDRKDAVEDSGPTAKE